MDAHSHSFSGPKPLMLSVSPSDWVFCIFSKSENNEKAITDYADARKELNYLECQIFDIVEFSFLQSLWKCVLYCSITIISSISG